MHEQAVQNANHVGGKQGQNLPTTKLGNISCSLSVTRGENRITGYALGDGTFCFLMEDSLRTFDTIPEAWSAWDKIYA